MTTADLIAELQSARPTAAPGLHEHVRAIAREAPARRPSPFQRLARLSPRRVALVALPAAAVVILGLAGAGALLDSGSPPTVTASRESFSQATTTTPGATRALPPQLKAGAAGDAATPAPTTGRAQRYSAELTPVGEGRRRALRRDPAGPANHA